MAVRLTEGFPMRRNFCSLDLNADEGHRQFLNSQVCYPCYIPNKFKRSIFKGMFFLPQLNYHIPITINSIKNKKLLTPPPIMEKIFFSETRPFFSNFCKKCIFTTENPKNLFFDKQLFTSSDARFCCNTCNDGSYLQNFVCDMHNFSLDMDLSP